MTGEEDFDPLEGLPTGRRADVLGGVGTDEPPGRVRRDQAVPLLCATRSTSAWYRMKSGSDISSLVCLFSSALPPEPSIVPPKVRSGDRHARARNLTETFIKICIQHTIRARYPVLDFRCSTFRPTHTTRGSWVRWPDDLDDRARRRHGDRGDRRLRLGVADPRSAPPATHPVTRRECARWAQRH